MVSYEGKIGTFSARGIQKEKQQQQQQKMICYILSSLWEIVPATIFCSAFWLIKLRDVEIVR